MGATELTPQQAWRAKRSAEVDAFVQELLRAGFRVWRAPDPLLAPRYGRWFVAACNGQLGFAQLDDMRGWRYSTRHKPNASVGTGFEFEAPAVPSVSVMRACCLCRAPEWVSRRDRAAVVKWDLDAWIKQHEADGYVEQLLSTQPDREQ